MNHASNSLAAVVMRRRIFLCLMFVGFHFACLAAGVPVDKLVLHAPLNDEQPRSIMVSVAGQNRFVPLPGNAKWQEGILPGKAFTTLSNATPVISEVGDFERDQAFSCAAWVRLPPARDGSVFARMSDAGTEKRGWDLWVSRGKVRFHLIHQWPTNTIFTAAKTIVASGRWTHICLTYDGSSRSTGLKIYIDGELDDVDPSQTQLTDTILTGVPFKIGQREKRGVCEEVGLQDLRIYERELSAAEVKEFILAVPRPEAAMPAEADLLLHIPFDDNQPHAVSVKLDGRVRMVPLPDAARWQSGIIPATALVIATNAIPELPDVGDFERDQAFSWAIWVKPGETEIGALFARMDPEDKYRGWDAWMERRCFGMHIIHSWRDDALKVITRNPIDPDRWTHLAGTYDGSSTAGGLKFYLNGKLQATETISDNLKSSIRTSTPLKIGRRKNGEGFLGAMIRGLRLYSRVLTEEEVADLADSKQFPEDPLLSAPLVNGEPRSLLVSVSNETRTLTVPDDLTWKQSGSSWAFIIRNEMTPPVPGFGNFERDNAFSCSAWLRLSDTTNGAIAARMNDDGGLQGWDFGIDEGRPALHLVHQWPDRALVVRAGSRMAVHRWTHLSMTYDGSSQARGIVLYVDGVAVDMDVVTDTLTASIRTRVPFKVGQWNRGSVLNNAALQDLRIYGRALTSGEIQALHDIPQVTGRSP
jgi:hypothetical protein